MARLHERMLGAAMLNAEIYEEVEADRNATGQAFFVVVLSALGTGIGSVGNGGLIGVFWMTVAFLAGWYLWAHITCIVGTKLLPTSETVTDHGELLRTIGFSSTPGILCLLGLVTPIAAFVYLFCTLWMLVAMVVAVRAALDFESTLRAVAVCGIGFAIYAVVISLAMLSLGPWPV